MPGGREIRCLAPAGAARCSVAHMSDLHQITLLLEGILYHLCELRSDLRGNPLTRMPSKDKDAAITGDIPGASGVLAVRRAATQARQDSELAGLGQLLPPVESPPPRES